MPDLAVDTPTVSDSGLSTGTRFTLSATVRNQGKAESFGGSLYYYRSTDSTISSSDTQLGTDVVTRLAESATSSQSIILTAPSNPEHTITVRVSYLCQTTLIQGTTARRG